jgi:hypothetical protein
MSPTTKTQWDGSDSPLRPVSLNPSHFRIGRWWLLGEGLLLVGLGLWGLYSAATHPHMGPTGAPVLWLALSPAHSDVLLGFGLFAAVATVWRRPTVIITGIGAVGFTLLFTIGTVAAVASTPGPLGFDLRDSALHVVLLAFNLALLIWLIPNALEGPGWVRRRARAQRPGRQVRPQEHRQAQPPNGREGGQK